MSGADQVRAAVRVELPPAEAFEAFTAEIDQWWRRGRKYRVAGTRAEGSIRLEPGVGGRLYETFATSSGAQKTVQLGEVLVWQPPARLLLRWRNVNFAPGESTEVEVEFAPSGAAATLVTVTHRGWSQVRPDHPARHGLEPAPFLRMLGLWWGDLLTALRQHGAPKPGA
ncbi:MAG: SRPBCC domain-containing protein [Planctomycetota bacterium]